MLEEYFNYSLEDNDLVNVNVKDYNKNGFEYKIVNYEYDNNFDDLNMKETYYRSVVKNNDNDVLCYSLPKSKTYNYFKENYHLNDNNVLVSEIIEGTMLNLFYNKQIEKWEISTKSAIGGEYFFYRNSYKKNEKKNQINFKEMFLDALRIDNKSDISKLEFINSNFDKDYCYSFIVQHPDNHIVLDIEYSKAYLICGFSIKDKKNVGYIHFTEFRNKHFLEDLIYYPNTINKEENYENMEIKYTRDSCNLTMGLMYYNKYTGVRSHNRHERYEKMRLLRGNNPNLQYQYLCLKKTDKIKDFLSYFPKYNKIFYDFYNEYKNFLRNVHSSYHSFFIKKNKDIIIDKKYFYHINKIHKEIFLPSINQGEKKIINKNEVYNYFESYDPIQQLYFLNYEIKI